MGNYDQVMCRMVKVLSGLMALAVVATSTLACADRALADDGFAAWLAVFRADARAFGIRRAVFDDAFAGVKPDRSLPDLDLPGKASGQIKGQAEFVKPPQAYLSEKYLDRLARQGRVLKAKHRTALQRIEKEIGVPADVVLAIWGRETAFGQYRLPHYAIQALATQAFLGRRKSFFREELLYALKMLQEGVIRKDGFRSSWAGAVGMTQFMPSEYFELAYDLDRDGRKDIWSAEDALASAANQLRHKGWERGKAWGFEVRLPAGVTCAEDGPAGSRTIEGWARAGVARVAERKFAARYMREDAFLFTPAGGHGPAFLVLENFMVFKRYNPSDLYALFVGHLADRIGGGRGFIAQWGGVRQLPASQISAIQLHLKTGGFSISKIDGKIGANTRSQIGQYQLRHKITVDCWPGSGLLRHMERGGRR
ncbi:MAG TPA: lytic murein transglycosylase [Hyphomicrobiaceae bacterium]|nr:lytic murein transglycosylase [Hyphomicrobiaceae bacterium]